MVERINADSLGNLEVIDDVGMKFLIRSEINDRWIDKNFGLFRGDQ